MGSVPEIWVVGLNHIGSSLLLLLLVITSVKFVDRRCSSLGDIEDGGPNESPIPPTLWPSVGIAKIQLGLVGIAPSRPKNGQRENSTSACSDGGSRESVFE